MHKNIIERKYQVMAINIMVGATTGLPHGEYLCNQITPVGPIAHMLCPSCTKLQCPHSAGDNR